MLFLVGARQVGKTTITQLMCAEHGVEVEG